MSERPVLRLLLGSAVAWEEGDLDQIVQVFFWDRDLDGPDLHLSVYAVELDEGADPLVLAIRVVAEQSASYCRQPDWTRVLDVSNVPGLPPLDDSQKGETKFALTQTTHRILHFPEGEASLRAWLAQVTPIAKSFTVTKDSAYRYASERLATEDPEWIGACAAGQPGHHWLENVEKLRKRDRKALEKKTADEAREAQRAQKHLEWENRNRDKGPRVEPSSPPVPSPNSDADPDPST